MEFDWTITLKDFFIAMAGALGGAYGAQVISGKAKANDDLIKEIRNTNAAIALAYTICNSVLSLKSQHVKRMKEEYELQRQTCLAALSLNQQGIELPVARFQADLQDLSFPYQPIDILQNLMFDSLSVRGRPLSLITTLAQTVESLKQVLDQRNQLAESYRKENLTPAEFNIQFFGLPYNGGHINMRYPSCIDAIYSYTNDAAFFSYLLSKDLVKHGGRLRRRYKIKFGKGAPFIDKPDFSKAIANGLMPKVEDYTDWMTAYIARKRPAKSRWARFRNKWYRWRKKGLG